MQVSVESTSALERRMTVQVPSERIEQEVEKRLRTYAKQVKMDGFRPGKVPMKIVRKQYGAAAHQEVLGEVIEKTYYEALTEQKLTPVGMPDIKPSEDEKAEGFSYTATFEVMPEVTLADRADMSFEKVSAEVTDTDLDNMLENLRKQRQEWNEVDREAAEGDKIIVDYEGKDGDEVVEGTVAKGADAVLGEGRLLADFEEGLKGIKAGEKRELDVPFPDDYPSETVKGKTIHFNVECHKVEEASLPEMDDEFAKGFGVEEGGVDALREQVKTNMQRELEERVASNNKNAVMDVLAKSHALQIPKSLVDEELERMKKAQQQQQQGAAELGEVMDQVLATEAERRVTLGLIIREIIDANDIKVDPERVEARIAKLAESFEDPAAVLNMYRGDRALMQEAEGATLEEQVVEWVSEKAQVSEVSKSFDDIMNPKPAEEAA